MTRRGVLLAMLAALGACAMPDAASAPAAPDGPDPDPEPVYAPGPIPWESLTEEHKRRARQALARIGEAVPDDEALAARWARMSPAQQRFMIRRPPPPPLPPPRSRTAPSRRQRTTATTRRERRP